VAFKMTVKDGLAELVLDKPPVNAFDSSDWFEMARVFKEIGDNAEANVVLCRNEGKGFCAGVDIKELQADSSRIVEVNRGCYEAFAAIHECRVPVVMAVSGFCLGGGIGMVGSADIIVASDDATFGLPEIDRGAMGAATHLARMFPVQKVRRMFFTGEPISAAEAYRLGAVESVHPREELTAAARELAGKIAGKSPRAVRVAKRALDGIEPVDIKRSYRFEQGFTFEMYTSPDSQEARDAFVEGREAEFKDKSKDD
jgi:enoyl-CoA hydratase